MIEVTCKKCLKRWHVFDEDWREVESCPFCSVLIEKKYEIHVNSFQDALKQIFLTYGFEILMEKKRLIAFFLDIYSEYKSIIKIVSNFCSEDMLEKIYNNRNDKLALRHEIKIIKSAMIENGISEVWAKNIGESFFYAVQDTQEVVVCLPNNFHIVEQKMFYQEEKGIIENGVDDNIKIGKIAYKFITEDKNIYKYENLYKEDTIGNLMNKLMVSYSEKVYFIHDDTYHKDGRVGYIITEKGIYTRFGIINRYITWKIFLEGTLRKESSYILLLNDEVFISHVLQVGQTYMIDRFFFELQRYLRQNIDVEQIEL